MAVPCPSIIGIDGKSKGLLNAKWKIKFGEVEYPEFMFHLTFVLFIPENGFVILKKNSADSFCGRAKYAFVHQSFRREIISYRMFISLFLFKSFVLAILEISASIRFSG